MPARVDVMFMYVYDHEFIAKKCDISLKCCCLRDSGLFSHTLHSGQPVLYCLRHLRFYICTCWLLFPSHIRNGYPSETAIVESPCPVVNTVKEALLSISNMAKGEERVTLINR